MSDRRYCLLGHSRPHAWEEPEVIGVFRWRWLADLVGVLYSAIECDAFAWVRRTRAMPTVKILTTAGRR